MTGLDELKQLARDHHQRVTGELKYKGVIQASVDLPANKVRIYVPSLRNTKIVNSLITEAGTWVWIELMPDHEYQVIDVAIPESSHTFDAALPEVVLPPAMGTVKQFSISGSGFVPGRVEQSQLGGLYIHVRSFWYNGGFWDDNSNHGAPTFRDFDLSSFVPGTADMSCWVLVYYVAQDGALHAVAGALMPGGVQALDEAAIADIALPSGAYPLGAVGLAYGQTAWESDSRFAEPRRFLSPDGYLFAGGSVVRTLSSGVLTVGSESVVIVAAESGTADTLDTITLEGAPRKLIFYADSGDTITVSQSGGGNIHLNGNNDFDLTGFVALELYHDGTDARDTTASAQSSSSLPAFGAGASKTLSSDKVSAGTDRHLVISAQTGTADDCIEVTGLSVGDEVIIRAASGHTITVKNNDSGATDKIFLYDGTDLALSSNQTLKLVKLASGVVVQYVDKSSSGTFVNPMTTLGDLITTNDAPVENASRTGNTDIGSGSSETVIGDLDLTLAGVTVGNIQIDINVWWSMNQLSVTKTVVLRLRRTSLAGAVLASNTQSATIDSSLGHDRQWSTTYVDTAITDGRYVITFQRTAGGVDVWSNTRELTLTATSPNPARLGVDSEAKMLTTRSGLPAWDWPHAVYSTANVSNPPTKAELTSAFGAPATLPDAFVGVVNDNGASSNEWWCWSDGAEWFYTAGAKAV